MHLRERAHPALPRSADFQVGCVADFQIGEPRKVQAALEFRCPADLEIGDTADQAFSLTLPTRRDWEREKRSLFFEKTGR